VMGHKERGKWHCFGTFGRWVEAKIISKYKIRHTCASSMEKQSTNHQLSLIHCIIQKPSRRQWVEGQGMENSQSHSGDSNFCSCVKF
jgi:hypothetical protein